MNIKINTNISGTDFEFNATNNLSGKFSQFTGKNIVLYFYPRDNTPGCTQETQDFRDLHNNFNKNNTIILGISRDTLTSHEKFKAKHNIPFELISDPEEEICNIFNVMKDKNMYGKQCRGIERSTFLFDESGTLIKEWRKVKVPGHAQEVLNSLINTK